MKPYPNVTVVDHPLVVHNLTLIRSKKTEREIFLNAFNRLSFFLLAEGFKNLPLQSVQIETPVESCNTFQLDDSQEIILAPILRAGLALTETAVSFLPQAHVWHIGMYRDEKTHLPVWYYDKTPPFFEKTDQLKVFILDPMLATGHSAFETVKLFIQKGIEIKNIVFISILSAPEGIELLQNAYPNLKIITAAIDEKLNEKAYIVPGLGDAGDRFFNTL